eukprot:m.166361 g.166361  ORF g.166361 m.166361 type:complete len:70 (-) comp9899_c0_seq5:532-741(-)
MGPTRSCPSLSHLAASPLTLGLGWPLNFHLVWLVNCLLHVGLVLLSTLLPPEINQKVPEPAAKTGDSDA